MVILQNISFAHPGNDLLFSQLNLFVNKGEKVALIGNNGTGKSTLLKIIAGELLHSGGNYSVRSKPYYIPQIFGQYNQLTVGQALNIESRLNALKAILEGNVTEENYTLLDEDWTIEARCKEALEYWMLFDLDLSQKMEVLSGGQKTKVFLAGILIHQPGLILLDEPTNHLDNAGRQQLYEFIQSSKSTFIIVSHDRKLLNNLDKVCELGHKEIKLYGGNYDFYKEQKNIEAAALCQDIQSKEKALRKAKVKEQETVERQQKLDIRGKGKQEKSGTARIMMNTFRNNAENSTSKMKRVHAGITDGLSHDLVELRGSLPGGDKMRFNFGNSTLYKGKNLFTARNINYGCCGKLLWNEDLNIQINSGDRISIKGPNASGKTTLLKLISGGIEPQKGTVKRTFNKSVYIDQEYSLILNSLKVYELVQQFNSSLLMEHEIKIMLDRFLFKKGDWDKYCSVLSGGEKMRLMLCSLFISNSAPDLMIFDEPTNNLDIQNIEILTTAINAYQGTLVVVSHDEAFLEQIEIEHTLELG